MRSSSGMERKVGPSMAVPPSVRMPHSRAMCLAVWMLSPVTMRTVMPARWHVATAPGTSLRTGSCAQIVPAQTTVSNACRSRTSHQNISPQGASCAGGSVAAATCMLLKSDVSKHTCAVKSLFAGTSSRARNVRQPNGHDVTNTSYTSKISHMVRELCNIP